MRAKEIESASSWQYTRILADQSRRYYLLLAELSAAGAADSLIKRQMDSVTFIARVRYSTLRDFEKTAPFQRIASLVEKRNWRYKTLKGKDWYVNGACKIEFAYITVEIIRSIFQFQTVGFLGKKKKKTKPAPIFSISLLKVVVRFYRDTCSVIGPQQLKMTKN